MNTHNHKLVICSLKRGQYLVNLSTMANGDIDSTWNDGDNINEAVEFAALYSEADLRALAESQGPDWEVQPEPEYWAIIAVDLEGPAYGVGTDEAEARYQARQSGFGEDGVAVRITAASFNKIEAGNPQAVEILL